MSAALISIIGAPGAGKTTMAEWLAEALPSRMIREDYAGNPFLEESYLGRGDLALPAQLYFLFSRISQLSLAGWPASGVFVSDYGFCQDAVYAAHNLHREDLAVYHRLAEPADKLVKPVDVLVYLDGSAPVLLERIACRGRRHERVFTAEFLNAIRDAYREIARAGGCPVVAIDVGAVDLQQAGTRARLLRQIRELLP